MARGHSHDRSGDGISQVAVAGRARWLLIACLVAAATLTVLGLVRLWPHAEPRLGGSASAFAAPGVTFPHAEVLQVRPACPNTSASQSGPAGAGDQGALQPSSAGAQQAAAASCGQIVVRVTGGVSKGSRASIPIAPEISRSGLSSGDSVQLLRTPSAGGAPVSFGYFTVDRSTPIWVLVAVFVVVVAVVARLRGLLALLGLGFGALVLVTFMLPALLAGGTGISVALVGSSAIVFVVLYLAHGVSMRTSAALAGTLVGILITALVGAVSIREAKLSGIPDESGAILSSFVADLSFQELLTAAVIVAGLGVLNDVTITQASAVWELRSAAPDMSRTVLFSSAMRIGRDHIASTIYTIVFAYAGPSLSVLLLLFLYDRPAVDLLSTEDIAEEVIRTLASGIGLILAVPVTTAIAVGLVAPHRHRRSSVA